MSSEDYDPHQVMADIKEARAMIDALDLPDGTKAFSLAVKAADALTALLDEVRAS